MKYIILVLVLILVLTGCSIRDRNSAHIYLPEEAIVLEDHGNGWIEFELEDSIYLYHHAKKGYEGYESLTKIGEKVQELRSYGGPTPLK